MYKRKYSAENKTGANKSVIYNKTVLDNGLKIITEEIPTVESFALGICVDAGSRDERFDKAGIAHYMEHAAFRRTKNRSAKQIATQFESLGAYTNAFTTKEQTCFYVRALKPHFKKCLNLLCDITVNPMFDEKEMEKERLIILEEIKSYDDDPEELVFDIGDNLLFNGNTLGNPIIGTAETVSNTAIEDLKEFHSKYYIPSNMIVSAAGNLSHDYVVENVKSMLGNLPGGTVEKSRIIPAQVQNIYQNIQNKPIQQAHILYGKITQGLRSEERYPLAVLNVLFGDGMSSRLYQNLRERHGIAYSIYSSLQSYVDSGAFYLYIATDAKKTERTEKLLFEEMRKIKEPGIKKTEFLRAKEQLKSSMIMELESMSSRMQSLCKGELLSEAYESIDETLAMIDSVTFNQITSLSDQYLNPDKWFKALLLPE